MEHHTPGNDGVLLRPELDELIAMRCSGRTVQEVEDRARALLLSRGGLSAWESRQRNAAGTSFLLGNHRLIGQIGHGDTYHVLVGQHLFLARIDALKVMHRDKMDETRLMRHLLSVRTQQMVRSPGIVGVHDAGYDRTVHFVVVDYIKGSNLRSMVRRRGALTMDAAATIMTRAAAALSDIHRMGFAHACLDPSKLIISEHLEVRLCDAGVGQPIGNAALFLACDGHRLDYAAPEAVIGGVITERSDIYSLGCILYYAVTGKVPFPGGTQDDKRHGHLHHFPLDPRRLADALDDAFVDVIAAMMAKAAGERIGSAEGLVRRLAPWAQCD